MATDDKAIEVYLSPGQRGNADAVAAARRLCGLNTAERLTKATKGSALDRALLIRDPNRLVSSAVLANPAVSAAEIESWTIREDVPSVILATIGNSRTFTSHYSVVANLVKNPRTPLGTSHYLLSRLTQEDLEDVSRDERLPNPIRKQALSELRKLG